MTVFNLRTAVLSVVACLAGCFFAATTSAETVQDYGPFRIQRLTEADGLVSSEITGVYKDHFGFLWISTFNGISRYDGRRFDNFGQANGLTEGNMDIIGEDDAGQLYARSISGIYRYTGNSIRPFIRYPARAFIMTACPGGTGTVWVAYNATTGIDLLSPAGITRHVATAYQVTAMVRDARNRVYVLEQNGHVSVLQNGALRGIHTIRPVPPYDGEGVIINRDAAGRIWSYGANNDHLYKTDSSGITDSVAVPRSSRWWQWSAGAAGGFYQMSAGQGVMQLTGSRWQQILPAAEIRGVLYDVHEEPDGRLWIVTSGGLLRVSRKQYGMTGAGTAAAAFATDAGGRYILRSDSLLYHIPNAAKYCAALQDKTLYNVYTTRNRDVWYSTMNALYWLPYGKGLRKISTSGTYAAPNTAFGFHRVIEDAGGGIWIVTYKGIFYLKDGRLSYYYTREGITENALYSFAIDRAGLFYVSGLRTFACIRGRFYDISSQLSLTNNITRLTTDQQGNVWANQEGNSRVIKIARRADGRFYVADSLQLANNGLPFAAASLAFDTHNNLWLCDSKTLYCYPLRNGRYASPGSPIAWNEHLYGSPLIFADDRGNLQVRSSAMEGNYQRTYSSAALLRQQAPDSIHVWLTAVRLFRQAFDWGAAGFATDALGIPQRLVLRHDQNFLHFNFTGLTKSFSQEVAYHYRLRGYDKGWAPVTGTGEAEYTGLPPGHYQLEVQARNSGGNWSTPAQYSFTIKAVWYRTWWATLCWILLACGAVGGLIYLRWNVAERRARLRRLVVEEQLKALRAQINPHFLQNTFAFLAHEMYTAGNDTVIRSIDRISTYLRNVLAFSDKATVTLEEELDFTEEYLQLQQLLLSIPFDYVTEVDDAVDIFDTSVPSMLLQPVIENALKHGLDPQAANVITIRFSAEGDWIRCVISDTGNKSALHPIHTSGSGKGIALTIDRMMLFYSDKKQRPQFSRHSNAAGGCDVIILIPTK